MLCVSILASTNEEALRQIDAAATCADAVEIRLDSIVDPDPQLLFSRWKLKSGQKPLIATCRAAWEGGRWKGDEAARVILLERAGEAGADYVDLEYRAYKPLRRHTAKLILSYHDFEKTPDDLEATVWKMSELEPDVLKIAVTARTLRDAIRVANLARSLDRPHIVIAMGEAGRVTRILYRRLGSILTFASLEAGAESAPGQVTLRDLRELYRANEISEDTPAWAVVGSPVAHSRSPLIFNALFRARGTDAVYVPLWTDDPAALREAADAFGIRGFSVTIPHKEGVIPLLDDVDPLAKRIGAMNTIAIRDGKWFGTNTDAAGMVGAIEAVTTVKGKRAVLIGAGGAARGMAVGLIEAGAKVTILNRTRSKAEALAKEFGCEAGGIEDAARIQADLLLNSTPVGMEQKFQVPGSKFQVSGSESAIRNPQTAIDLPVPTEAVRPGMVVFDAVYTPAETGLLRLAKERGAVPVSGVEMFLRQAALQTKIFTGTDVSSGEMAMWRSILGA